MESIMNTQKQKNFNKNLRYAAVILTVLQTTVGMTNGYAYRHTPIRNIHDYATQTTRARHNVVTSAARDAEDAAIAVRRAFAAPPGALVQARYFLKDIFTLCKRTIRDTYIELKREVRDTYVTLKREVEDLF
jgi:hypothetical protein